MSITDGAKIPQGWLIASDYDAKQHLMNLKGRDYLNVQNRLLWFIKDQREFIKLGVASCSYSIVQEEVYHDRQAKEAEFKTTICDCLGNVSVAYGSESIKDFADYAEKAATKSLGRALLGLGYGTAFAPEMDEGTRVVDSPVEHKNPSPPPTITTKKVEQAQAQKPPQPHGDLSGDITDEQKTQIQWFHDRMTIPEHRIAEDCALTTKLDADLRISALKRLYEQARERGLLPAQQKDKDKDKGKDLATLDTGARPN